MKRRLRNSFHLQEASDWTEKQWKTKGLQCLQLQRHLPHPPHPHLLLLLLYLHPPIKQQNWNRKQIWRSSQQKINIKTLPELGTNFRRSFWGEWVIFTLFFLSSLYFTFSSFISPQNRLIELFVRERRSLLIHLRKKDDLVLQSCYLFRWWRSQFLPCAT